METLEFLKHFFPNGGTILPDSGHVRSTGYKTHHALNGLTRYIDYKCEFTPSGNCKKREDKTCCCGGCYHRCGYLENIFYKDLEKIAALFKEKTGFWSEKGCTLPREMRSTTCLGMHCTTLKEPERQLLALIGKGEIALEMYYTFFDCAGQGVIPHLENRLKKRLKK